METAGLPDITKLLSAWYVLQQVCKDLATGGTEEIKEAICHAESLLEKEIARQKPLFALEHENSECTGNVKRPDEKRFLRDRCSTP